MAYKNLVGERRNAWRAIFCIQNKEEYKASKNLKLIKWYKERIEKELEDICKDVLELLEKTLIKNAPDSYAKVFYMKMRGDYFRYLCEF